MTFWRLPAGMLAVLLILTVPGEARDLSAQQYEGRLLRDVLVEMQRGGIRVVFSDALVTAEMRISVEPTDDDPRLALDAILEPFGLTTRAGAADTILVVRMPRPGAQAPAAVPATGTVAGRVVEARNGRALPGVLVSMQGTSRSAVTSSDGRFELTGVPVGAQTLFVSIVGFALAEPRVEVTPGSTAEVTVPLADGTGGYSEDVVVTGDAFRGAASAVASRQSLTSVDLQDLRGVMADDPFRAVQSLPVVATGDDFRSEFSIRGAGYRQIGASVDGVFSRSLVHSVRAHEDTGSIAIINGDVIDRVTVNAGAAPQIGPGGSVGSLEFDIRPGSRAARELRAAVSGSSASVSAEGPLADGRGGWLVAARQSYLQWLLSQLETGDETTAFGFTDAQAKVEFDVAPNHRVDATVVAGRSRLTEIDEDPGPNSIERGDSRSLLATASWRATLGQSVLLQRVALTTSAFRNLGSINQELADGSNREAAYIASLQWAPTPSVVASAGTYLRWQRGDVTSRRFGYAIPGAVVFVRERQVVDATTSTASGYGRLQWTGLARAVVDAGVQVSRSSLAGQTVASPWALVAWPVGSRRTIRAGWSLARQFPEIDLAPAGAEPLRAERARLVDVSFEERLTPTTRVQATAYHRAESDVLDATGVFPRVLGDVLFRGQSFSRWRNALTGSAHGVELLLERRSATGLSGWLGYNYGRARYTDAATGEAFATDHDQRHGFSTYARYLLSSRTTVSAKLRIGSNFPVAGYFERDGFNLFVGERRNAVRLPVYARLDLRANRTFNYGGRRLTLFVEILNVLNRTNYGPGPGFVRTSSREAISYVEELFPFLPSAGFLFEF